MEPLWDRKVTRQSIEACLDRLIRKYQDLPGSDRDKLSEQDVRDYFITPLLEALGWGTVDPRERVAEKHLPRKGFSDYELCLPIGHDPHDPYLPVLYVEAKRFGGLSLLQEDLFGYARRSEADNQAIAYADEYNPKRGEKIGWAILTNFEIFRLWDTRRGVLVESTDWAGALKTDRTLEILYLLSRDQVAQDPRLVALSSLRKLPDIDEKFLTKLNEWRESLAGAIWKQKSNRAKLGTNLAEQQANLRDVVQRTLDRLIVIRTAEDRGLLPVSYRLQDMVRNFGGANAVPLMLLKNIQNNTFKYFDHQYNSKLFGAHPADQIEVHNLPLSLIIDEMCKAGFSSMNADILGATYEQYLGQTIEIDPKEDTPKLVANLETRHAQGSYYTPRYIVQYIVDHTLGRYLYGTENGQANGSLVPGERRKAINEIQELSVLDPACGSGSFLIYAFDVLLTFCLAERKRLGAEIESRIEAAVKSGIPRLAAEATHDPEILRLKGQLELTRFAHARIIERHLYGVDLDPQAAEVASMNLLLKALTRNERLPRILGDNVKVGNSLISGVTPDADISHFSEPLRRLAEIRKEMHRATLAASENGADRDAHEKRIEELEEQFRSTAEVLNRKLNESLRRSGDSGWFDGPESKRLFNWQIEFPEVFQATDDNEPGFSFVVGNPPYVGFHGFAKDKPYIRSAYPTASGKFDIYVPFVERGLQLACAGGQLSFICPSTFMKRGFGARLRRHIRTRSSIQSIHDFLHTRIFREALNYTCICIFGRESPAPSHLIAYSEGKIGQPKRPFAQSKLNDSPWVFRFGMDEALVDRIKSTSICTELGSPKLIQGISEGIVTGKNSVLLVKEEDIEEHKLESEFLRKCVRGEDVKRYCVSWSGSYVIYPYKLRGNLTEVVPEDQLEKRSPNLYAYLLERRGLLESREYLRGTSKLWYEIWCPRDIRHHECAKIVVPELADRSQFAWVGPDFFYVDTTCGIVLSDRSPLNLWYLLAVLNSKTGEYLYRKTTVPKANGYLIYKTMFLSTFSLPIPQGSDRRSPAFKCAELAEAIQQHNTQLQRAAIVFGGLVNASLPITSSKTQSFNIDYYSVPSYWKSRRLIPADSLALSDPVLAMRVENGTVRRNQVFAATRNLIISYQSEKGGRWKPLVEIEPANEDLRLFILLAARRFLAENARRKVWKLPGAKAPRRTVDVVLGSLVLPLWSLPHGSGDRAETNLRKISELMAALRKDVQGEINPSVLEAERDSLDQEIDEIVFDLYGLTDEERRLIRETVRGSS